MKVWITETIFANPREVEIEDLTSESARIKGTCLRVPIENIHTTKVAAYNALINLVEQELDWLRYRSIELTDTLVEAQRSTSETVEA